MYSSSKIKVVLFCGGLGMRMRDYSINLPKPLVRIGDKPIIWYLINYYYSYHYSDFILALGYKAEKMRDFFVNYEFGHSIVLHESETKLCIEIQESELKTYKVTLVDTGLSSNIGSRLKRLEPILKTENYFLANYADGLTDLNFSMYLDWFLKNPNSVGCILSCKFQSSFHSIESDEKGTVMSINSLNNLDIWCNAGFFIFKSKIFDYLNLGEDLVEEPFLRLIEEEKLISYRYEGFWHVMDTFKDKILLDKMIENNDEPWIPKNNVL